MALWTSNDGTNADKPKSLASDATRTVSGGVVYKGANTANVVYGVSAAEIANANSKPVAHTGWVKVTSGTGGRAGRIQSEVLVAGGIAGSNTADDANFPGA